MVVMDYVHGSNLAKQKSREGGLDAEVTETVRKEVRRALRLLHNANLVFGDLRPPNVMITTTKEVKLIDFDWAGDLGQAEYPCLISPSVHWPGEVRALDLITIAHDDDMYDRLLM
jgi:serine/threonine protein kinase